MGTGAKHLTKIQVVQIGKKLEEVVERVPTTDGTMKCRYKEGDDGTVAVLFGVHKSGVAGLRKDMFGNLYFEPRERPKAAATSEDYEGKIRELVAYHEANVARYEALSAKHDVLTENFNRLVVGLSLNKVIDCRHLEVPTVGGGKPAVNGQLSLVG